MDLRISPRKISGTFRAPPSKSEFHRALILAALSNARTVITGVGASELSDDIIRTADAIRSLGASLDMGKDGITVTPPEEYEKNAVIDCGESGSTLRFMLPVCAALGGSFRFIRRGRLPDRPISSLTDTLTENGVSFSKDGCDLLMKGHLNKKDFCVPGNESSQYITGILLAQTVCGGTLHVSGRLESAPYVEITLDLMRKFGICTERSQNENGSDFKIQRLDINEKTARTLTVGGDWSGAANLIAAGATALGLDENSAQGDRAILDILISTGASVEKSDGISAYIEGKAKAADVDMRDTPDLVPLVAVLCANAKGKSVIRGTRRLRLKESDRVESTLALLGALGIEAKATEDSIEITGGDIRGGEVDSFGDHRIAMAAAVASCFANGDITVRGAECVAKSFPPFWETFRSLGASFTQI